MNIQSLWGKIKYQYRIYRHASLIFQRLLIMTSDAEEVVAGSIEAKLRLIRSNKIINLILTGKE